MDGAKDGALSLEVGLTLNVSNLLVAYWSLRGLKLPPDVGPVCCLEAVLPVFPLSLSDATLRLVRHFFGWEYGLGGSGVCPRGH